MTGTNAKTNIHNNSKKRKQSFMEQLQAYGIFVRTGPKYFSDISSKLLNYKVKLLNMCCNIILFIIFFFAKCFQGHFVQTKKRL